MGVTGQKRQRAEECRWGAVSKLGGVKTPNPTVFRIETEDILSLPCRDGQRQGIESGPCDTVQ